MTFASLFIGFAISFSILFPGVSVYNLLLKKLITTDQVDLQLFHVCRMILHTEMAQCTICLC